MRVTVRFFAAARAAAGTESAIADIDPAITLGELEALLAQGDAELLRVLDRCSYLRDAIAFCDRTARVGECTTIDVLPPFAGG